MTSTQIIFNPILIIITGVLLLGLTHLFRLWFCLVKKGDWLTLKNILLSGILSKIGNILNVIYIGLITFEIFKFVPTIANIQNNRELLNLIWWSFIVPNTISMILLHSIIGISQKSIDYIELQKAKKKYE